MDDGQALPEEARDFHGMTWNEYMRLPEVGKALLKKCRASPDNRYAGTFLATSMLEPIAGWVAGADREEGPDHDLSSSDPS